jgi:DNA-binding transcriptional LysR family regulator
LLVADLQVAQQSGNDGVKGGAVVEEFGRGIDANLLLALHALIEERNLTHAGTRLTMSQPAMSGALARLRKHFDDELLVRVGREYELTPLAEKLRPVVTDAVAAAEQVFSGVPLFDPGTARRTFSVSLSEYAVTVLTAPLVRQVARQAPHTHIDFTPIPTDAADLGLHLLRRDLIVGPAGFGIPGRRQPVFSDRFVCVVAVGNPWLHDGELTLDDLREMPHAVARFGQGGSTDSPDDLALHHAGVPRTAQVVVPSLLTLPTVLAGSDLVGFAPERLVRRCAGMLDLVVARTPLPPIPLIECAHWHPSRAHDPALSWLRNLLHDVAVVVEDS